MIRKYGLLFLGIIFNIGLFAAVSTSALHLSSQQTYTGYLSILWIDDFEQKTAETKYYLSTTEGQTYELLLQEISQDDLAALVRREVIVSVRKEGTGEGNRPQG